MRCSHGFTIVEVLVSLLILSVGLLGVLSALASTTRLFADGHASVRVSATASELLELARANACDSGVAVGARNTATASFTWSISDVSPGVRLATVVVSSEGLRSRTDTFSTLIPC